eukprot:gnl/Spiro4/29721_TR14595_c0_g1_i1.p1 gnl/Spiro4/29721_TR14595_c0_g1~~gnl/Spiro4/29721_TR14595_c0_g1_i1.p1  ORF type:complete len:392 (+),score=105.11 gnl/Spiro4/29721_TR14595_c0_g1_i1:111-1178(+)
MSIRFFSFVVVAIVVLCALAADPPAPFAWNCEDLVPTAVKCNLQQRSGYIQIDGRQVYYEAFSPAKGSKSPRVSARASPLVFLHGGPSVSHHSYLPLRFLACATRREVVFYDQMGCGNSTRVANVNATAPELLTVPYYVRELQTVLDALQISDDFALYGHSWGSMLAFQYLLDTPIHNVTALVVSGSVPSTMEFAANINRELLPRLPPPMQKAIADQTQSPNPNWNDPAFVAAGNYFDSLHLVKLTPFPDCMNMDFANLEIYSAMNGPTEFTTQFGLLKDFDVRKALSTIPHAPPTLVLRGEDDEQTESGARDLATLFPASSAARVVSVPLAGHMTWLDNYAATFEIVSSFLNKS